jgi:hypothetical protein
MTGRIFAAIEGAYLEAAGNLIESGRYAVALRTLARHERFFPNGALAEERRELQRQATKAIQARTSKPPAVN